MKLACVCVLTFRAVLVSLLVALWLGHSRVAKAYDYAIGADLSFLKQAEDRGAVFKDGGEAKPGLRIFRDHGEGGDPGCRSGPRGGTAPADNDPHRQRWRSQG